jgi:ADP-dependent NAD(P)H-hydrate dehydratase / NAD(P)H-hydrate epimerase
MQYAYSVESTRRLEASVLADVGDDALMQRAAHGLFVHAARFLSEVRGGTYGARVLIMVGPGNNGGDALFAGSRLAARGCHVVAVRCLGEPHPAGLAALRRAGGRLLDLTDLTGDDAVGCDLMLDGVLGIGGRPGLPEAVAAWAARFADWGVPVVAVDLPSGVAADTGAVPQASFRAQRTVTFGSVKPCHLLEPARSHCGRVEVVDIGLPLGSAEAALSAWEADDVVLGWPVPGPTDDKYARGVVGVDTGSDRYPGAAVLSTFGAVYGGAGMVRFNGPERAARIVGEQLPNVVFGEGRVQSWVLGSGWGDRPDGRERIVALIETGVFLVLDADALLNLPPDLNPDQVLLTPHAGELARMLDRDREAVTDDPVGAVREAARRTGATVLLKGATQLVHRPEGPVHVAVPGPAWTGQAGSGDTLGGLCAALLAAGHSTVTAGVRAASMQAMTATDLPGPVPPQELARHAARLIGRLTGPSPGSGRRT